jgi:exopolyphosphatase/guanosine-5'-triphosphate,3'-diphosphate pyrophosphatase
MRVAVVDIGTNSTRLLIAEVSDGRVETIERDSNVTRLGEGVDSSGRLSEEAIERVLRVCSDYRKAIDKHSAEETVAVLTAAVRDAENGPEFEATIRDRFGFEAQTISGEREARLTYLGATSHRKDELPLLVIDIGGGSTEFVVGRRGEVDFHVSTDAGSVRFTERTLHTDPPTEEELENCRRGVREEIERSVPQEVRRGAVDGIAVAGTATQFAAIDLELDPYDPERVEGYRLGFSSCERILAELAALPLEERRQVKGLDPDRAPMIVAGGIILREAMRCFGFDSLEISEHDILEGAALEAA